MQKMVFIAVLFSACSLYAQTQYFPPRAFCIASETQHCGRWYEPHLEAMKEPSLWEMSKNHFPDAYRFLWLRTFHHPVSARLQLKNDGSGELIVKALNGEGGYKPGDLVVNKTIEVSKNRVDHFLHLLEKAEFWSAATELENDGVIGCDGAQWIMEGTKSGQYHVVDRWSPNNGPYRQAGLFLAITLGGLNPRHKDVY